MRKLLTAHDQRMNGPSGIAVIAHIEQDKAQAVKAAREAVKLTPLNEDTMDILGRPNFTCIRIAARLREMGRAIPDRAEHEQAAVVHFLLNMYEQHGADWRAKAEEFLKRTPQEVEQGGK
jgi:hypothetical protein